MDEAYKQSTQETPRSQPIKTRTAYVMPVTVAVVFGGLGFFGGVAYQKSTNTTTGASQAGGMGMMAGQRQAGGFGTVSAVTDNSISITNDRSGETQNFTISSATKILNGSTTAAVGDIKKGDMVLIQTSGSTDTEATEITINPSMPSGGPTASTGTNSATTN